MRITGAVQEMRTALIQALTPEADPPADREAREEAELLLFILCL